MSDKNSGAWGDQPEEDPPEQWVIVMGKQDDFLYMAPTVAHAVQYVTKYTGGMKPGVTAALGQKGKRLTLAEMDFFNGLGQPLTVVPDSEGKPGDLKLTEPVTTVVGEVRHRIMSIYRHANTLLQLRRLVGVAAVDDQPAVLPADADFTTFVEKVMIDPHSRFKEGLNCSWWQRMFGGC